MDLILLRHGQSTWNLENLFTGWVDVPLSPRGIQARRIVLLGLGKPADLGALRLQRIGGALCAHLNRVGESAATVAVEALLLLIVSIMG